MSGRGRVGIVAAGVAVVVAAVLAVRGCGDDAGESTGASSAPTSSTAQSATSAPRERSPRVRASETTEASDAASATQLPGEPFLVDGWPAAQVIVRRPDGSVAPGACVYVYPADADTPASLDEVVRGNTDAEGKFTLVAPEPGRYDVGAFVGPEFESLVTDVEFPARGPVDVVLPALARLAIRAEGDLPADGHLTLRRSTAVRVTAFPGRRESKYADFGTGPLMPQWIYVPRGVPLRVDAVGGVTACPAEVTAPGTITVRPDGARPTEFEFVFTGAEPPRDALLAYTLDVAAVGGGAEFATKFQVKNFDMAADAPLRVKLPCVPGQVEVRWNLVGVAKGTAVVDTSRWSDTSPLRVDVPVTDWGRRSVPPLRVIVSGGTASLAEVVTDASTEVVDIAEVGRERQLLAPGIEHVAALGPRQGPVLVADPVAAETGRTLDLRLVPGGTVRITVDWSQPLGAGWPITVERADGLPILIRHPPGRIGPVLAPRARIDGVRLVIGPLAAGDVELVFRLAGREFGRKRVTVRADEMVELAGPPLVPPGRR